MDFWYIIRTTLCLTSRLRVRVCVRFRLKCRLRSEDSGSSYRTYSVTRSGIEAPGFFFCSNMFDGPLNRLEVISFTVDKVSNLIPTQTGP